MNNEVNLVVREYGRKCKETYIHEHMNISHDEIFSFKRKSSFTDSGVRIGRQSVRIREPIINA